MTPFEYSRPTDPATAIADANRPGTRILAGGTNLVDLMKENVERPERLVDIRKLPYDKVEELPSGGLRLGSLVTNAATAYDERIQTRYPMLASAILAGASAQLRNAATNGGNINQRTRCFYFYDTGTPCNKREPGGGCGAIGGLNRIHAILGASASCIAVHPSDMCVALTALDAEVRVIGSDGERTISFASYHRLPEDEPSRDNTLRRGEIVTAIDLPAEGFANNYSYLKVRDRLSYAFALVSVAAALKIGDGKITDARVALGGVAHKPWRDTKAEALLTGGPANERAFHAAAEALLLGAKGQGYNNFKIELARRSIVRALTQAANATPQSQTDKRVA